MIHTPAKLICASLILLCILYSQKKTTAYIQLATQQTPVAKRDEHHLFLKFSALALQVNEPCELFFFLYDARQAKLLRY